MVQCVTKYIPFVKSLFCIDKSDWVVQIILEVPWQFQLADSHPWVWFDRGQPQSIHHSSSCKVPEPTVVLQQQTTIDTFWQRKKHNNTILNMGLKMLTLMYFFLCKSSIPPTTPATSFADTFLKIRQMTNSSYYLIPNHHWSKLT